MCGNVLGSRLCLRQCGWLWHVAGQQIIERGDIRRTLNTCVTAQCQNSSAGTAHVTQQQLHDCSCTDDLDTLGLLCPANCIAEAGRALASRVRYQCLRDQLKLLLWHSTHVFYHLGSIAGEVAAHNLEHALRMLKCGIAQWMPLLVILILPTTLIGIGPCFRIIAGEDTI